MILVIIAFGLYLLFIFVGSGVLKQYLRELPEPLMTFELYSDWMQAAQRYTFITAMNYLVYSINHKFYLNLYYSTLVCMCASINSESCIDRCIV